MALHIEHVNKVFKNSGMPHIVLNDVSFTVEEGEFVSLLGPSGCGKTTLLTIVAGFQAASSGQVRINGNVVTKPGPDRGFVFQDYALFPWMTVKENIVFPMKQQKVPSAVREEFLQRLLSMVHMEGKENLYPSQLSGGMKQRTAMVRALACRPKVLLMDEPLGAVDYQMRQMLQEELEAIWISEKTTVLMVTHDVDEAVYLSDRIIVMSTKQGEVLEDLRVKLDRPRSRKSNKYFEYKDYLSEILITALTGVEDSLYRERR
ncbi:ABC transporter ATP-binding protein SaoA [Phosphitispora sp. TUW77]|uniref:ABC transporter ATP-binding protein SaoA n=1 Tax=Phosphitispora sp. TUW77 TaxID=3152361 RepID=UPI003AB58238